MNTLSSLPLSPHLPVKYLSASFNNITNSYKFYWFLSILEHIKENQSTTIPINNLIARMIAGVWYPSNYFKLSFGKQDRLSQIALAIKTDSNLSPDASKSEILNCISTYLIGTSLLSKEINSLAEYVPYRFLRPFFSVELRSGWYVECCVKKGELGIL